MTGDASWLKTAESLLERVLEQFVADGSFYDTAADAEALVWRPKDTTDNASPSGVSLAAEALTTLASLTGSTRYETAAAQALTASAALANRAPRFAGRALAVAETLAAGPLEIAIAGTDAELLRVAITDSPWGTAVVQGEPGLDVPLMEGRGLRDGRAAAYVCQKFTCRLPVVLPEDLRHALRPVHQAWAKCGFSLSFRQNRLTFTPVGDRVLLQSDVTELARPDTQCHK